MLISLAKKTSVIIKDSTVTSATEEYVNDICFDNLNNIDINEIDTFVFLDDTVLNDNLSYTINNGYTTDSISFDEYVPPRAVECISENSTSDNVHQSQAGDSDNNSNIIAVPLFNAEEIDDYGVKKMKIAARVNKKKCKLYDESYKKLQNDGSIVTVDKKIMKENPCLGKKCTNECNTITEEERLIILERF